MFSELVSLCLYVFVGIISLTMAYKNLFSDRFIPFHEKAAGKPLEQVDNGLQAVIIALMRVSGLGFLAVAVLLILFPIANYYAQNTFIKYAVPAIALVYCSGLFLINYQLYSKTGADTPWKRSLYAVAVILLGFVISLAK
jgi:hypothetical protein